MVDYPTIQVLTFYPGASPDVMTSSVTAPMERQFGQIPGLQQMSSTSSFGGSMITLQFDLKQNIDVAEQEVQAAINASASFLPRDLPNPPIYSKVNPADTPTHTPRGQFPPAHPPHPADLQQSQSRRHPHPHPRPHLHAAPAQQSRRPR